MTDDHDSAAVMVETQLRPNGVTDRRLIAAMRTLPREPFVPEPLRWAAYMDGELEVLPAREAMPARYLLSPMVQARLIQLAGVQPQDTVLDVGCATGYSTAVLARLAHRVVAVEPMPDLRAVASENLKTLGIVNAMVAEGGFETLPAADGPFDVVVMEGSVPALPDSVLSRLEEGGRLSAVLTRAPDQRQGRAYRFLRVNGEVSGIAHFDASASPLPGFSPAPAFAF